MVKKINTRLAFVYYPNGNEMDQMTSHVIAYRSLELFFSTHTFHFNCFFEDFNCVFTQIRCLSRVLAFLTPCNDYASKKLCFVTVHCEMITFLFKICIHINRFVGLCLCNGSFLSSSIYCLALAFEYYQQVNIVHSRLQDESLQVTISKLP